jgi:hypothetical protein
VTAVRRARRNFFIRKTSCRNKIDERNVPQKILLYPSGRSCGRIEFLTLKIPQQRKKVKREKMNNKKRLHSGAGAKAG